MICPNCKKENEEDASFCRHCGASMNVSAKKEKEIDSSSILIFLWIAITIVTYLVNLFIVVAYDNWDEGVSLLIYVCMQILSNIAMILPVLAIKNKSMRITGIVIMSLFVLWMIRRNINWLLG